MDTCTPPAVPLPTLDRPAAPRDCWARLIATVDAGTQPAPTLDIRQSAAARKLRDTVLAMLRNRARQASHAASNASADFEAAAQHHLDAMVRMQAVLEHTPPNYQPVIRDLLTQQLRVLLAMAAITTVVEDT